MKIQSGNFGIFKSEEYELILSESVGKCSLIIRSEEITNNQKMIGFREYVKHLFTLDIRCNELESAYQKNIFCIYNGGKYEIGNFSKNKVVLFPDLATKTQLGLHIYDDRSIDVDSEIFFREVKEVWEIRQPIEGLKFNVEPVVNIKLDNRFP